MFNKPKWIFRIACLVFFVGVAAACVPGAPAEPTVDPNAIYTQAAKTVEAQLTQTSLAMPTETPTPEPSPTPEPTATLLPLPTLQFPPAGLTPAVTQPSAVQPTQPSSQKIGDHATYLDNIPRDGHVFSPGETFTLITRWRNTGTTTWNNNYQTVFLGGIQMSGVTSVKIDKLVKPNENYEFYISQRAPDKIGDYITRWKLVNDQGFYIYEMYFSFKVR